MKKTKSKTSKAKKAHKKPRVIKVEKPKQEKGMHILIKRQGHSELYDERKVYGSCYFACRNAHIEKERAEVIADQVSTAITKKVIVARLLSSDDLFRMIID